MGLKGFLRENFNGRAGEGLIGYRMGQRYDQGPRIISPTRQIRDTAYAVGDQARSIQQGLENIFAPKDAPNKYNILERRHNDGSGPGSYNRGGFDPRDAGHRYTGRRFSESPTITAVGEPRRDQSYHPTEAQIAEATRATREKLDSRSEELRRRMQSEGTPSQANDEEVDQGESPEVEDPASAAEERAAEAAPPPPPPPPPTQADIDKANAEEAARKKAAASQPATTAPAAASPIPLVAAPPAAPAPETRPDESFAHLSVAISDGVQSTTKLLNQFSSQGYSMMRYGQGDNVTYVAMRDGKVYGAIAPEAGNGEKGQSIDNHALEARLQKSGQSIEKIEYAAQSVDSKLLAAQAKPEQGPAPEAPKATIAQEAKGGFTV